MDLKLEEEKEEERLFRFREEQMETERANV